MGNVITPDSFFEANILIVDDEVANVRFLEVLLTQAGYRNVHKIMDARLLAETFVQLQPDLLLLDLHMPHVDGLTAMAKVRQIVPDAAYFPILVLTADTSPEARRNALAAGAKDFLSKPLDVTEVLLRVRNLLSTRLGHLTLDKRVKERTSELESSQLETLERLALAAEYRDDDTGQHTHRVARTAALLARTLNLSALETDILRMASPLHDVGKIGIHDDILLKPGRLTPEEFMVMKQHTLIGAKILSGSRSRWLQVAEEIAMTHHERWDGSGYPAGLAKEKIPLTGRIVTVADVYDALTHERPYKAAWDMADAVAEIRQQSGSQFDPRVVQAFCELDHVDLL